MKIKSLVVEDSEVCGMILQKMLSPLGLCDVATEVTSAISHFLNAWEDGQPYDVIWMDILLPGIDGMEITRRIRNIEKVKGYDPTYIVFVSALTDMKDVVLSFFHGCHIGFIEKPVAPAAIREELCHIYCDKAKAIVSG